MTLEEAQAQILDLQSQLEAVTTERDSLSQKNSELSTNLENARELNQRLFERSQAQHNEPDEPDEPDEPVPTCEEFANTIII